VIEEWYALVVGFKGSKSVPTCEGNLNSKDYRSCSITVDLQYFWSNEHIRDELKKRPRPKSGPLGQMMDALGKDEHVFENPAFNTKIEFITGNRHPPPMHNETELLYFQAMLIRSTSLAVYYSSAEFPLVQMVHQRGQFALAGMHLFPKTFYTLAN
jgi:hypothetical protein